MTATTRPTIDSPAVTQVTAKHYFDPDDDVPALTVDIDLTSLGLGSRYEDVSFIHNEDGEITIVLYPADDDEGWARLDDVGEW